VIENLFQLMSNGKS